MGSILGIAAMMAMAMAGGGMTPTYGMPRMPRRRREPDVEMPATKHAGDIPKGCTLETVRLQFIGKEQFNIFIEVDLVYGTKKARHKKLVAMKTAIAYYIHHRWIGDIEKDKRFTIETIITPKDETTV